MNLEHLEHLALILLSSLAGAASAVTEYRGRAWRRRAERAERKLKLAFQDWQDLHQVEQTLCALLADGALIKTVGRTSEKGVPSATLTSNGIKNRIRADVARSRDRRIVFSPAEVQKQLERLP